MFLLMRGKHGSTRVEIRQLRVCLRINPSKSKHAQYAGLSVDILSTTPSFALKFPPTLLHRPKKQR